MPGFDGTGPLGQGPMTGRAQGFCVLTSSKENPDQLEGLAGLQGRLISKKVNSFENAGKELINMPAGNGTGPVGLGPMTGRAAGFCAGFSVPGYTNPAVGRVGFYSPSVPVFAPYGAGLYGYGTSYGVPYGGWGNPWFCRGFGFSRGFGRGRGCGRGRRVWR